MVAERGRGDTRETRLAMEAAAGVLDEYVEEADRSATLYLGLDPLLQ